MHAFDLERVQGATIRVRRARAGETLKTLDGVERHLDEDDLVICDAAGPVALAGVMGGGHSEVANTTRRILLEVASFDPRSVRRTGRRHGLHTESSHRFERGIDHGDSSVVMATAMSMGIRLAGGAALRGTVKATGKALAPVVVRLRSARLNAMLGIVVPFAEAKGILARLGFQLKDVDGTTVEAVVPSHRPDITREVDLIEEVIRVRGLETVPAVLPSLHASRPVGNTEALMARVRSAAVGVGLSEAVTFSFVSPRDLEIVGAPPAAVLLRNPLSENQSVMRTSLLPGLLAALGHARRHGEKDVRLFTVGRIFLKGQGEGLPREQLSFAAILAGHRGAHLSKPAPLDAWDLKGVAEGFVERFAGLKPNSEAYPLEQRPAHLHPKAAVLLALGGRPLGHFGLLHPDVTDALDLGTEVFAVELDVEALAKEASTSRTYKAIPRFPGSTRDLAVVVHEDILAGHVEAAVREAAGTLAESIEVFDRFVGGSLPQDHASLALRIVYRRHDRTLTDAEVDTQHASVVEAVTKRFSASLRA
jgi:phenylalanyl-tRNA synthetase beta chain